MSSTTRVTELTGLRLPGPRLGWLKVFQQKEKASESTRLEYTDIPAEPLAARRARRGVRRAERDRAGRSRHAGQERSEPYDDGGTSHHRRLACGNWWQHNMRGVAPPKISRA